MPLSSGLQPREQKSVFLVLLPCMKELLDHRKALWIQYMPQNRNLSHVQVSEFHYCHYHSKDSNCTIAWPTSKQSLRPEEFSWKGQLPCHRVTRPLFFLSQRSPFPNSPIVQPMNLPLIWILWYKCLCTLSHVLYKQSHLTIPGETSEVFGWFLVQLKETRRNSLPRNHI